MNDMFDLSGSVVVVTGGAGLIGRALVRGLAEKGAIVHIAENNITNATSYCGSLQKSGLNVKVASLDITNESSIKDCFKKVIAQDDRIDVLINNAYPRTKDWGLKLEDIPVDSWRMNIDQHLNGYCLTCRNIAEIMREQRGGSIINIASVYGMVGPDFHVYDGTTMTMPAAYSAIKGGIINFTRYLASYYGAYGVRANCISPGGVLDGQSENFVSNYCKRTPLGRMAIPEDIVGASVFLSSRASLYVTGHNLVVDGGWTAI